VTRDTQLIELMGRHRLIEELLRDGVEVALPLRDRGVDLVAYADLGRQVARFSARPIQMKAVSDCAFLIDRKYERLADLILAYVWNLDNPSAAATYALTYPQAVEVGEEMGWTKTTSWQQEGKYVTTSPSQKLVGLLEQYRMGPGRWWTLVTSGSAAAGPPPSPTL
jgi:hypothetical protein